MLTSLLSMVLDADVALILSLRLVDDVDCFILLPTLNSGLFVF